MLINELFLKDREVAMLLGCSRSTVWRRVQDGTLPKPVKIGSMARFPQSEVEAAIERLMADRFPVKQNGYSA